jgi:hypothetical protein
MNLLWRMLNKENEMQKTNYQIATESAAKACGFKIIDWYSNDDSHRLKLHVLENVKYPVIYDPLRESEDAFETAARLNIQVEYSHMHVTAYRTRLDGLDDYKCKVQYIPGDHESKVEATRQAITFCAAHYAEMQPYVQYDDAELEELELQLKRDSYCEVKLDISGGFWVATDGVVGHIGESRAEAITLAIKSYRVD